MCLPTPVNIVEGESCVALRLVCPKVKLRHAHNERILSELEASIVGKFSHMLPKMNTPLANDIIGDNDLDLNAIQSLNNNSVDVTMPSIRMS